MCRYWLSIELPEAQTSAEATGGASSLIRAGPAKGVRVTIGGELWDAPRLEWPSFPLEDFEHIAHTVAKSDVAQRTVISRFESDGHSVVVAASGIPLCGRGTRLPLRLSTMYTQNARGSVFTGTRLDNDDQFDRVSDRALPRLRSAFGDLSAFVGFRQARRCHLRCEHGRSSRGAAGLRMGRVAHALPNPPRSCRNVPEADRLLL